MNSPRGERGPHGAFSGRIIMALKHLGGNLSGNLYWKENAGRLIITLHEILRRVVRGIYQKTFFSLKKSHDYIT